MPLQDYLGQYWMLQKYLRWEEDELKASILQAHYLFHAERESGRPRSGDPSILLLMRSAWTPSTNRRSHSHPLSSCVLIIPLSNRHTWIRYVRYAQETPQMYSERPLLLAASQHREIHSQHPSRRSSCVSGSGGGSGSGNDGDKECHSIASRSHPRPRPHRPRPPATTVKVLTSDVRAAVGATRGWSCRAARLQRRHGRSDGKGRRPGALAVPPVGLVGRWIQVDGRARVRMTQ